MRKNKLEKHLICEPDETEPGFYLGCYVRCRENEKSGAINLVELQDGAHSSEQGVADAYELHKQLGFLQEGQYVMVRIEPLPALQPDINREAVKSCQKMLGSVRRRKNR